MQDSDKAEFANVMKATIDSYGRRPPLPETMRLWFEIFRGATIDQFRMACLQHVAANAKEPPTPASLLAIMKGSDGRPAADEAWAIALRGADESETVVVNDEIMEAWAVALPVYHAGDEVGARMAFKDAYKRITSNPAGPVKWWPSLGSDPYKRDAALGEAQRSGLLPAPQVAGLLPNHGKNERADPEGSKRLKKLLSELKMKGAENQAEADERRALERQVEADRKAAIDAQVKAYKGDKE